MKRKNGNIIHWSGSEGKELGKYCKNNNQFIDLCRLLQTNCIAIPGAYTCKLKDIGGAMHRLGLIQSSWSDLPCRSGTDAIGAMLMHLDLVRANHIVAGTSQPQNDLCRYNEIDCKTMCEIAVALSV